MLQSLWQSKQLTLQTESSPEKTAPNLQLDEVQAPDQKLWKPKWKCADQFQGVDND